MKHIIVCPKCNNAGFFEYGDVTHKCTFEKCDGHEFTILYDEKLLRAIIADLHGVIGRAMCSDPIPPVFKAQQYPDGSCQCIRQN